MLMLRVNLLVLPYSIVGFQEILYGNLLYMNFVLLHMLVLQVNISFELFEITNNPFILICFIYPSQL